MRSVVSLVARFWSDDQGFVVSSELILIATVIVLGAVVGLSTFREQLVQELGDAALGIGALDQSYSIDSTTVAGFTAFGSAFEDAADDCDARACDGAQGRPGVPPACINIGLTATGE